jgi:hypothetical protein
MVVPATPNAHSCGLAARRDDPVDPVDFNEGWGPGFNAAGADSMPIRELPEDELVTVGPGDSLASVCREPVIAAGQLMANRRICHLAVVEGQELLGVLAIRAVVRGLLRDASYDAGRHLLQHLPQLVDLV